jgi:hypothetical protein
LDQLERKLRQPGTVGVALRQPQRLYERYWLAAIERRMHDHFYVRIGYPKLA